VSDCVCERERGGGGGKRELELIQDPRRKFLIVKNGNLMHLSIKRGQKSFQNMSVFVLFTNFLAD